MADSKQFIKVERIIKSDPKRRYIIPSAPGKRNKKDHKVTDLLYMCQQLAAHDLNFDEVYNIVKSRYIEICEGLNLDFNIIEILDDIRERFD